MIQAMQCCFIHGVAGSQCSVGCDVTEPKQSGGVDVSEQTQDRAGVSVRVEACFLTLLLHPCFFLYYQHNTGSGRVQLNSKCLTGGVQGLRKKRKHDPACRTYKTAPDVWHRRCLRKCMAC